MATEDDGIIDVSVVGVCCIGCDVVVGRLKVRLSGESLCVNEDFIFDSGREE